MTGRRALTGSVLSVVILVTGVLAAASNPVVTGMTAAAPPDRPFDLERRLEALDPSRPLEYLELAEELADGMSSGPSSDRALARRLYGLAGRLDLEGLGASAALGIASLESDPRSADRYRAAALLLDPDAMRAARRSRPDIDIATAMEISEAFGDFRTGRANALRKVLDDPARMRLLRSWVASLPGGEEWLTRQVEGAGRGRPDLDRRDALAMIRVELVLLDRGRPDWSTLLAVEDDPPIVDLRMDRVPSLLLDDDSYSRPRRRDGDWVD